MAKIISSRKKYVDATDTIQFVHKHEDSRVTIRTTCPYPT